MMKNDVDMRSTTSGPKLTPLLPNEVPASAQSCPKCRSVFLTETQCESCGVQLSYDPYGQPLDDKSFYSLKSQYHAQMSVAGLGRGYLERLYPERVRAYKRGLVHRYKLLLEYLTSGQNDDRRKYFIIEIKDMIGELVDYKVSKEVIWQPLDMLSTKDDHLLYEIIQTAMNDARRHQESNSLLSYKWFDLLSTGMLVRISLAVITTVYLALAIFRYLSL